MSNLVNPGIHPQLFRRDVGTFSNKEWQIIKKLGKEWYVTRGDRIQVTKKSIYRYVLLKPTQIYTEMFNLDRELVVVFSDYPNFEPRTLRWSPKFGQCVKVSPWIF